MGYLVYLSRRRARLWFLLFLVMAAFIYLYASPYFQVPSEEAQIIIPPEPDLEAEEKVSRVGEKIVYDVLLGKLRLGKATYHHLEKTTLNNKPVNLISFLTELVKFRDRETIYCDPETFLPIVINRKISRLVKQEHITEEYDQEKFILTITKKRFGTTKEIITKEKPMHNSILLPYCVRNQEDLDIGWSFTASLPQGDFEIILKSIENITVPAGDFKVYYFESDPSKIKIWMSADEERVPVRIEGTGGIGYSMVMREYHPPLADDSRSQIPNSKL